MKSYLLIKLVNLKSVKYFRSTCQCPCHRMGFRTCCRSTIVPIPSRWGRWLSFRAQRWPTFAWWVPWLFGRMGSSRAHERLSWQELQQLFQLSPMSGCWDHFGVWWTFFGNLGHEGLSSPSFWRFWPLVIRRVFWYLQPSGRYPWRVLERNGCRFLHSILRLGWNLETSCVVQRLIGSKTRW